MKRRLATHLTLRGSREFADEAAFARFVAEVCTGANALRSVKVAEERIRLQPLPATRHPEADESCVRVSSYSTVRVKQRAYSVPARLIGALVQVQVSEAEVVVRHEGAEVVRYPRTIGCQARIDYRHRSRAADKGFARQGGGRSLSSAVHGPLRGSDVPPLRESTVAMPRFRMPRVQRREGWPDHLRRSTAVGRTGPAKSGQSPAAAARTGRHRGTPRVGRTLPPHFRALGIRPG
ncbi:MAG: Mu transposase domain-containing protein [Opitutaceae bacterium]